MHDATENEAELHPEEVEMLNPPVGKDEEAIEIEGQNQTSSTPEEQSMIDGNNKANSCD